MASEEHNPLAESGVTIHSDSEQYSAGEDISTSPDESSSSPHMILYKPPTTWSLIRGVAINLLLPFINGMMLGFGELFAHEAAFRLGWGGTKVFPLSRRTAHPIGPGIEIREKPRLTKPTRTTSLSTRQFSQAQSQSSVLSRGGVSRANTSQYGQITPSISTTVGYGTSVGIASSSVFAQRSGATRNLSLWPFQSKPQTPQASQTTATPAQEWSPPAEAQSPVHETTTTSSLSTPAEPVSNAAVPPPPSASSSETDLSQFPDDLLRGLDSQSLLDIPERIGFLRELGLDYGTGPSTCCQWLVEHIHVYSGMPWWFSIAAVAVLFRGVMFYPTLAGSKHSGKMQAMSGTPEFKEAKARFDEAVYRSKDRGAMLYARAEMQRLNKRAGISQLMPFVSFAMLPFTYGMFRLVRGMAGIPVPGMETGGLAWFTDLTVHDPLFVLPIISTGLAVLTIQQMQRANLVKNPAQETMMNVMKYIMPPLMFMGTAWLPAGLQWFFFCLSMGSVVQTQATLNPVVRAWADLPPLPTNRGAAAVALPAIQYQSPAKKPGLLGGWENGMNAATKSIKEATGATDEKAKWQKAKEYEDQRAEEERQKAMRRMDEVRRRRAERHS
ncbi:hypothetical protein FHL15_007159 [Xylaria flabelliformis]|uniref:Membrane insertase YidC/Oxa/ALB C-terminal domain-containing protein n=1 Tax=Xylaria flabelliformis TaxID=2512241 RepID=A0A553HV58_9PEZI|nr:hypothetical protein FHL15_007159 [Xylaria flabelliformis]